MPSTNIMDKKDSLDRETNKDENQLLQDTNCIGTAAEFFLQ
jgi:hypothetical protein